MATSWQSKYPQCHARHQGTGWESNAESERPSHGIPNDHRKWFRRIPLACPLLEEESSVSGLAGTRKPAFVRSALRAGIFLSFQRNNCESLEMDDHFPVSPAKRTSQSVGCDAPSMPPAPCSYSRGRRAVRTATVPATISLPSVVSRTAFVRSFHYINCGLPYYRFQPTRGTLPRRQRR